MSAAAAFFSTGMDSPVSADWPTKKSLALISRKSAGMIAPACRITMSPGTISAIGMSHFLSIAHDQRVGLHHGLQLLHRLAGAMLLHIRQPHAE